MPVDERRKHSGGPSLAPYHSYGTQMQLRAGVSAVHFGVLRAVCFVFIADASGLQMMSERDQETMARVRLETEYPFPLCTVFPVCKHKQYMCVCRSKWYSYLSKTLLKTIYSPTQRNCSTLEINHCI